MMLSNQDRPIGMIPMNGGAAMKKITIYVSVFWMLVALLLVSLFANVILFDRSASQKVPPLAGSYCTNTAASDGVYLVFDHYGNYCKYTQAQGLLEEGTYEQVNHNQYILTGSTGICSSLLLTHDGVYCASTDASLVYFPRFSDIPTFVGNWREDWAGFPQPSGA